MTGTSYKVMRAEWIKRYKLMDLKQGAALAQGEPRGRRDASVQMAVLRALETYSTHQSIGSIINMKS
jgi:hypothetical protein